MPKVTMTRVYTKYDYQPEKILVPYLPPMTAREWTVETPFSIYRLHPHFIICEPTRWEAGLEGVSFITYSGGSDD